MKKLLAFFISLTLFILCFLNSIIIYATDIISDGIYYIENAQSGRYVDIAENSTSPYSGDKLEQWD